MKTWKWILVLVTAVAFALSVQAATQTENLGIRALPAPGKVTIDGKTDDWDLRGGIFACDNVETLREKIGVWCHLMYDEQYLYVLGNFVDETPLNNPGQTIGDYGFSGDSMQIRFFFGAKQGMSEEESPEARVSHWTCWKGVDGADIMDVAYGQKFNQGGIKDAKTQGAQQAFATWASGKGYAQEMAIPWKLLTKDGKAPRAGDKFVTTFEPNFTVSGKNRLSVKDNFKPGITLDRVFTFQGPRCWGWATLEAAGSAEIKPLRLADGREFPVKLEAGMLTVNWDGLIKRKEIPGFKPIKFTMPADGYVSLNINAKDGSVARQLLNGAFVSKGEHEVKWDGLTTWSVNQPGTVVEPGDYTWSAIVNTGIGLRLKGWACNSGSAPWDGLSGKENWGGDHGYPVACAAEGDLVFLGWSGAEAGQALLAVDLQGNVKWRNKRQGMCGAELVAVDNGVVYAVNWGPNGSNYIYRVNAKDGSYTPFAGTDSPDLMPRNLWPDPKGKPDRLDGLDARNKKLYLAYTKENTVMQVDGVTGKLLKTFTIKAPSFIAAVSDSLVYVVSEKKEILALDPASGETKVFKGGLVEAHGITVDKDGKVYAGVREPENQIKVFSATGELVSTIGRAGGRAKIGPWTPDGILYCSELTIDKEGKLWVMEAEDAPKRISVWNTKDGAFVKEFFGPSSYGALGGAINPRDPNLMLGQGCEWRIDPKTGKAVCLGTFTREGMENTRFATGSNGKLYAATATRWAYDIGRVNVFERIGDGNFKLRSTFFYCDAGGNEIPPPAHGKTGNAAKTALWCDENDDQQRQPNEITMIDGIHRFSGWYMPLASDLTFYAAGRKFACTGFTPCGAPKWNLKDSPALPAPKVSNTGVLGSPDGARVLYGGEYGKNHAEFACFDIASGKKLWSYPDNFVGVHGSHNACPAEAGMIRGSFGPCASVKLPEPLGNVWVIATNVGEWHLLNEKGFYVSKLFETDPLSFVWPEAAVPGAIMDNTPCGMGGEDFGGSATLADDGKLYVQAGKTAFWNLEVTGLDTVKALPGGTLQITEADLEQARAIREKYLQAAIGTKRVTLKKASPAFSGNIDKDFGKQAIVSFKKSDDAAVRSAAAWDEKNLYLAWEVKDSTPWTNSAENVEEMYLRGDTVDFQLGTDPNADKKRGDAVRGDLRLSIGSFKGNPTAVIYRKVSTTKNPKTFSSGVIKEYVIDNVSIVSDAAIKLTKSAKGYVVEAAIPLSILELKPADGLVLNGDFGVTHGDQAGQRTRLRTYWNNQSTGIVDDAVFELKVEPKNWGEIEFKE
ncbi:MAG TPA: PQQ-binding-like beta-propeller repeat protein [Planctomycetota bacterium]|nr:PQQ-binding-like beta-propeller repeat protein [Planctomycetota bacterium]